MSGALRLTSDDVGFLCSRGYSGILLSSQEGQQLFAALVFVYLEFLTSTLICSSLAEEQFLFISLYI